MAMSVTAFSWTLLAMWQPDYVRAAQRVIPLLTAVSLMGCVPPVGVQAPTALSKTWMFGIDRMAGDPAPQLPFTNRMIADLAAMPNVQVVYADDYRNAPLFQSWQGGKVLVSPWLHAEGNCMNITYTIFQQGEREAVFGLAISPTPAGQEPDSACVDRATTQFYQALVIQGL
jgi:hypothetical protein